MRLDQYFSTTPPRCLAGFRPDADPSVGDAGWRLRCACGCGEGAVLGHRLGDLKPGFEEWDLLVSPLAFRCAACGRQTPILDTGEHGEGSEFARRKAGAIGGVAYRGEGEAKPAACPACGVARAAALVCLTYHEDRIADYQADPSFPLADYFDSFTLECECAACGRKWDASQIETK